MTIRERDAASARLLEVLEQKLCEALSRIRPQFGEAARHNANGLGTAEAMTLAAFFRDVAIEADAVSLLGSAEILDGVAHEVSDLDDVAEEQYRREMAEEFGGDTEVLMTREPREP